MRKPTLLYLLCISCTLPVMGKSNIHNCTEIYILLNPIVGILTVTVLPPHTMVWSLTAITIPSTL